MLPIRMKMLAALVWPVRAFPALQGRSAAALSGVSLQVNYATKLQVKTGPGRTRGHTGILHDQFSAFITLISLLIIAI